MNILSRTITGIAMMILGLFLIGVGFFVYVALVYGIIIFVLGIFVFFNKGEDEIEEIRMKGGQRK